MRELLACIRHRLGHAGIVLTEKQLKELEQYYSLLAQWNRTINLTALPLDDHPDSTLDRLLIEPLIAAQFVEDSPLIWFDLGSGGGSPAIPLKLVRLRTNLKMVESRARKSAFLRDVVRILELPGAEVVERRIEDLFQASKRASAMVITVRAVRMNELVTQASSALLGLGGYLLAFCSVNNQIRVPADFRDVASVPLPSPGSVLRVLCKTT